MERLRLCFSLLSVQCLGGWWPANNCLSICYSPVELRNANSLYHQSQAIRDISCVDCVLPLCLARRLESVWGRVCSLASEKHQESVLTVNVHQL